MRMNPIPSNRIVCLVERRLGRVPPEVLESPRVVRLPLPPPPRPTDWIRVHRIIAAATRRPTHLTSDERAFVDDLADRRPRYLSERDLQHACADRPPARHFVMSAPSQIHRKAAVGAVLEARALRNGAQL
jgi:hypothetical protein